MDSLGVELTEELPDWERSPLTLEVRNQKKHRRLFTSVKRSFLDLDDIDPDTDFGYAEKLLKKTCTRLEVKEVQRLGIRQWFAADLKKTFALMVDEFSERFLARNDTLGGILSDKTKDVAYAVDFETTEGWRYNLRMGPMTRAQWFLMVGHESSNFESGEAAVETLEKYQRSFPEQFLYIDIDCYKEDTSVDKMDKFLVGVRRRSHDLATKLIEYCKK